MSTSISNLISIMNPKLQENKKNKRGFQQVFQGKTLELDEGNVVSVY